MRYDVAHRNLTTLARGTAEAGKAAGRACTRDDDQALAE